VAETTVLDRWSGKGVKLSKVIDAVAGLSGDRRSSPPRTACMTLVAVARSDEQARRATEALRVLANSHPARILLLRPEPDEVASLDADASLYGCQTDHNRLHFEEIVLHVGGQAARHLDSVAEPFTLSDLPVGVWSVSSIPDPSDPLLSIATASLIDSRDAPDVSELRSVLRLTRNHAVVDLSWNRLAPLRELVASLFDHPSTRRWVELLERAEVSGKDGPRRLIGGWLIAQSRLSPRNVSVRDAQHVSVKLTARDQGSTATFSVTRPEGQRLLVGEAVLPDGEVLKASSDLPSDPVAMSLAAALTLLRPDPVWERALSAVAALAD
jgi:glucose-6-phosphate dehydrogenase assembly protein OpcA